MAEKTPSSDCSHLIDHSHISEFEVSPWIKITLASLDICIFVAGILGNSITIKTTRILQKKGYLQKEVTDHMVSLACSDLLVILLGMPVQFLSAIWKPFSTPNGNVACKLYYFLFEACSYATVLHVATLSFERYVAICHPFKFKAVSGPRKVKILIAFVWGTSVIVALPLLFAMGTEYPLEIIEDYQGVTACTKPTARHLLPELKQNMTICTSLSSKWPVFQASIFSAFAVYIIVLGSVAFMCRSMMKTLMIHKKGTVAVRGEPGQQEQYLRKSESSEGKSSRRQIILFLGLIVATLAICWMPNQIRRIMAAAKPKQDWTVPYFRAYIILLPIADIFFYLSSVVNPLLYNISSQQFRSVFLQVLRCHLTIEHANKEKFLRANLSSRARSNRSLRPLLFMSSKRSSSTRSNSKSLSTFQNEANPNCSLQKPGDELQEPSLEVVPLEMSSKPGPDTQNGLCEREV
ncbi:G protein-coupled receptor 39 [Coturnix japonica]|uniref:G-protein coupled receptor 39 n=1 Tax=Coturnix japonica TaxID=93934 RepID=A9XG45_COTJA|nr:G-protein coupled receptor 39 [Coturnix japonica]ABP48743.1 G-protein coupled receptor 39 [Coturnix japonica]